MIEKTDIKCSVNRKSVISIEASQDENNMNEKYYEVQLAAEILGQAISNRVLEGELCQEYISTYGCLVDGFQVSFY